ncbi:lipocalin [Nonlabens sp. Ci31]|uniref:lipocalin family protein n=1 Tax=Nonlabens sp. Ci31 TaxID=2608253 RepID=UPI00146386E1|nr:lipocalin family protein [Nonlabens sp. Ci31]QJP35524.1 lipocalin [Nonlabens sp. Ci31]
MKNFWVLGFLTLLLVGCAATNAIKETKRAVLGNWVLTTVTYDGNGAFKSTLLQDVSASCFEGSEWYFVANNNRGTYTITDNDCKKGERKFIWSVPGNKEMTEGDLLLKITDANYRSETNAGYQLELATINETRMSWRLPALVNGKTVYINMNFTKSTK